MKMYLSVETAVYLSITIGIFVFFGFIAFIQTFKNINLEPYLNFIWNAISVSFILASLTLALNEKAFPGLPKPMPIIMGSLFVLSGIGMLCGMGMYFIGKELNFEFIQGIGSITFYSIGLFSLSWSIGIMAVLFLDKFIQILKE